MRSLFSNLNARLIIINLIAFWLFFYAFQTLSFLHDYNFLYLPSERMARLNLPARRANDMNFIKQAGNFGLVAAYVISWFVANKRDWHWLNGVISFVITFTLCFFGWFGWSFLHGIFQAPSKLFAPTSVWGYLISGVIMIALGLLVLLSKKVISFIEGAKSKNAATYTGKNKPKRTR
ncbi:hypothetical protein [Mucilaginibacter sp.]|uniref:hypothetical protein n=1 Tax=Mucilaginibacter sp. TaxID=1882438 RepID=UPI00284AC5DB|nr:hypothetical protein [Mucilaginibacter sp.]MDR3693612.1 hypothetical protein [Mucilaginibacter sp.]